MTAPVSRPPGPHEDGRTRLDPGLVELVKALARASAARDSVKVRRGGKA